MRSAEGHQSTFALAIGVVLLCASQASAGGGIDDPQAILEPAPLPPQPVGVPFLDPVFGTTITRLSDTSDSTGFGTHIYSQLQAFSSDNQYLLLIENSAYVARRLDNNTLVAGLDSSSWNAPRWHPAASHTVVHFDSNDDSVVRLQFTDIDTLTTDTVFTFPSPYATVLSNQSFDELSEDGRWLAGMALRNDGEPVIFSLDTENLALGAELPLHDLYTGPCQPDPVYGDVWPDWVGVSPLGNYLVVQWVRDGTAMCSGLETYDIQSGAFVGRVNDSHPHGDLGVHSDGVTEYFMTIDNTPPPPHNNFPAMCYYPLPGTPTAGDPVYLQFDFPWLFSHLSCRGPNGVGLVTSVTDKDGEWGPFEQELFLQYDDGSVLRLVHHRSSSCGYWVQPRASISRDGRYVVFASDWGLETGSDNCGGPNDPDGLGRGDPYIIDLWAGGEPEPVPTASEWGLIIMALLLLTAGTIVIRRLQARRPLGEGA